MSANLLYLGALLTVIGIVMYFVDPSAVLRDTAGLEVTAQGQHYALGIFVLTPIAILFALAYQWRCGVQGVLLSMGAFWPKRPHREQYPLNTTTPLISKRKEYCNWRQNKYS